ncbi:MAG: NlpC/P60 family protein [Polyangiales bacterium]
MARQALISKAGLCALLFACGGPAAPGAPGAQGNVVQGAEGEAACPSTLRIPAPLPNVQPNERTESYWVGRYEEEERDLDATLLSEAEIQAHNTSMENGEPPLMPSVLSSPPEAGNMRAQLQERLGYMRQRIEAGEYLNADGSTPDVANFAVPGELDLAPSLRVATGIVPVHCGPRAESILKGSMDPDFDRNLCFTVRAQEPIELLREWEGGLLLARTDYGLGFVEANAPLTPDVGSDAEVRHAVLHSSRSTVRESALVAGTTVPVGALLPREFRECEECDEPGMEATTNFLVATAEGLTPRPATEFRVEAPQALTRRAFLNEAFSLLDEPYGWGGRAGGRDCSRALMDIFARFGLRVPRHSAVQAQAGTYVVDVSEMSNADKVLLFESAAEQGVVLLHFPGHIMHYLGLSNGRPMILHSFSEYLTPCPNSDDETVNRVDRVDVSDMTLGEGSSRTDFLSRTTHVTVFGSTAGAIAGAAQPRSVVPPSLPGAGVMCDDGLDNAIFRSPFRPNPTQPLRVIATLTEDPGPVAFQVFGPDGEPAEGSVHVLGGPPYTHWFEIERPVPGRYVAVLGDGPRTVACERFTVARSPPALSPREPVGPAWESVWSWERDTENLYSAFVEQLFLEPRDEDPTWNNLQELLRDPARNLLFNHRHMNEDLELRLIPDCADLPYFLRSYFAWKVKLPFAWRQCRRGREGQPPLCEEVPSSNMMEVEASSDLDAYRQAVRVIGRNVHSSTDRTRPLDENTDVYPVALDRYSLRPGTIFADPYGHIIIIAGWRPQGISEYGVLVGADAQPDGTVGRRRFWRGSFLFTPDTQHSGAGFKAWRPVRYNRPDQVIELATNSELRDSDVYTRISEEQYAGSADDFYDRVDALINARPLPAMAVMESRVDALLESVERRITSVNNGEEWVVAHGPRMEMPDGASIFQTEGPWEEYATPSRDMRLLISIDAVANFPAAVRRGPERFGISAADVDVRVAEIEGELAELLDARSVRYRRSDGVEQTLTLAEVVARARGLEMAYNPNDCVEIRWGAPANGDEMRSCRRHAPPAQRAKMQRLREWFSSRQRPAR